MKNYNFLIRRRIFFSIIICVFSFYFINIISAEDVSTEKSYNAITKEITITNSVTKNEVALLKLISPLNMYVIPGKDREVAEIEFENFDSNFVNALNKVELNNLKTFQSINRVVKYKYAEKKLVETDKYDNFCVEKEIIDGKNRTQQVKECNLVKNGTKIIEKINWIEFKDLKDLPSNKNIVIGLFTDVYSKDYVEWVPTFFGVEINEWAFWQDSYNIGLFNYWNFNENTGEEPDRVDGYTDITNFYNVIRGRSGIINNAYKFNGLNSYVNATEFDNNFNMTNGTISLWVNLSDYNIYQMLLDINYNNDFPELRIIADLTGGVTISSTLTRDTGAGTTLWTLALTDSVTTNVWHNIVLVHNGTSPIFYLDGSLATQAFIEQNDKTKWLNYIFTHTTPPNRIYVGANSRNSVADENLNGSIDEIAFWNRSLSESEIQGIYLAGLSGYGYGSSSPPISVPIITLNYPNNNLFFKNNKNIYFNYTAGSANGLDKCELWLSNSTLNNFIKNYTWVKTLNYTMNYTILNLSEGSYKYNVKCNDTQYDITYGNENFSLNNYTFYIDTTYPMIVNITPAIIVNSKTISFTANISDLYLDSCFYSIYNNTGDVTNNNASFICSSAVAATVPIYSNYTLFIYANDSAGNLNFSFNNFTTYEETIIIESTTGGGNNGPTIIIQGNLSWSIENELGGSFYDLSMSKDNSRTKELRFKNLGIENVSLRLSCLDIVGDLCKYVSFEDEKLTLLPQLSDFTTTTFTIAIPEEIEEGEYSFNIDAIDQNENEAILTTNVDVSSFITFIEIINKLFSFKNIDISNYTIPIPYIFISLFIGSIIFVLSHFFIFKKIGFNFISVILAFLSGIIILFFV